MVTSTPITRTAPNSQKHLNETCRLWEQECLRAWLEMKQDIAQVQQDSIKLNRVHPAPQHPQSQSFSHIR
ncbi:MAG: hypothetical protein R6U67_03740 [Sodalinema sp.]|uniref:hypothetical protein n=1 Tax=Sodalinema sp. TaxID=3080550 RepID=UPI0011F9F80C|nr:MAG: hypothetical protein EYR95_11550 [Phormidium sp. SL48-SHIP]